MPKTGDGKGGDARLHPWRTLDGRPTRIIAHRGASGYRPEHTLDGYSLAAAQGADVLEPDLVMSGDGVLYARHDLGLSRSTDVSRRREFAGRAREIAGQRDWYVSDFSAAELDTLRAIQPFASRGQSFDGQFALPRFSIVLDLLAALSTFHGRRLLLYPELKHPQYFRALGLDPVGALHAELASKNLLGPTSPVWIQCFDHDVLREAKRKCGNACFALVDSVLTPELRGSQLSELSRWAAGIAPGKYLLWDNATTSSALTAAAHAHGLEVHAWTFRDDQSAAPLPSPEVELNAAFGQGVDAVFCDFPDRALAARHAFQPA